MVDLYEENLTFKLFFSFLFLGLFLSFIFLPLSFLLHSLGHGIFGTLSNCQFIGIYLPLDNHSNAVLNYPSPIFSGTKGSLIYWFGGHIFIFLLIIIDLFFPTGKSLIEMIAKEIFGFYIAFFGGSLQAILAFYGEETRAIPDIIKINPYILLIILSVFFLIFSFYFFYRLNYLFGKSFKESLLTPLFLNFSVFYFPILFYLFFIYFMKGFVFKIHFPVYLFSTIFLLISPLIPKGKNFWVMPKFSKPIYGLFLLSISILFAFYILFYRKEFPLLLWGKVLSFCNLPLEIKI